jgi:hypothetical protein
MLALAGAAVSLAASSASAASTDLIFARAAPDMIVIWRVNAFATSLAARKLSDDAFVGALEAHAETIMATRVATDPAAQTIEVRLVYVRDENDPRYHVETLGGVDRIGTLEASAGDVKRAGASWERELASGHVPTALHVDIDHDLVTKLE